MMSKYHEWCPHEFDMIFFSNTRTRRRTVFTVLLVWLFAVGAGWANACVLQDRSTHVDGVSFDVARNIQAPVISAGHVGALSAHDDTSGALNAPCLKVCNDGALSMLKAPTAVDPVDHGMAPPVTIIWTAHATAPPVTGATRELPPPLPGLPLRIRYTRLAL